MLINSADGMKLRRTDVQKVIRQIKIGANLLSNVAIILMRWDHTGVVKNFHSAERFHLPLYPS